MSRPLRIEFPGAFYHVMSRGNEQKSIFKDSQDYKFFLKTLAEASGRWQVVNHAYALMGNHYHLLLETKAGLLSIPMRHLNGVYTQYFNRIYQRIGHLFHGRFKAILVEKESYLLTLSRYIHQNPVKAGMATKPEDYEWSSYRAFMGLALQPPWLSTNETLQEFGSTPAMQRQGYQQFVEAQDENDPSPKAIGKVILGSNAFIENMKSKLAEFSKKGKEYGYQKIWLPRVSPKVTLETVCQSFGIAKLNLLEDRHSRIPSRPLAMMLLRDCSRLSLQEIGTMFHIDYPAVSISIKRFEKRLKENKELKNKVENIQQDLSKVLNVKM